MAAAEVIVGVAAAMLGLAAVLIAIVQTTTAVLQCWQVNSRCGRSITGAFVLGEGIFFSLKALAWNPRYRMPVLTMPYLRIRVPAMEPNGIPVDPYYGKNFSLILNSYLDLEQPRITSIVNKQSRSQRSFSHTLKAIAWTPIGALLSLLASACCAPCCFFAVVRVTLKLIAGEPLDKPENHHSCGDDLSSWDCLQGLAYPLSCVWMREENDATDESVALSPLETPGLESAAWVQFLVNMQASWWGYADIRWEWRLASQIPQDVYGATAETTMADIQLLAAMSGMYFTNEPGVLCRSRCGDLITLSDHPQLGRVAYYRSGRDNAGSDIFHQPPQQQCAWLHACIAAQRMCLEDNRASSPRANSCNSRHRPTLTPADRAFILLSRKRSIFDAQLNFATGNTCWIFSSPAFVDARQKLQAYTSKSWEHANGRVFLGPLGQGVDRCSCLSCFSQWYESQRYPDKPWKRSNHFMEWNSVPDWESDPLLFQVPTYEDNDRRFASALMLSNVRIGTEASLVIGQHPGLEDPSLARAKSGWETHLVCHSNCPETTRCRCRIARLCESEQESSIDAQIAVVAVNTQWLSRAPSNLIRVSAMALVRSMCNDDGTTTDANQTTESSASQFTHTVLPEMEAMQVHPQELVELVGMVIAYTEWLLPHVRYHIGAVDIWSDCYIPPLTDFTPVIFGS